MKHVFTLLFLFGISTSVFAQCDNAFFPFDEGVSYEQTSYDKKGKEQGKTMSEVVAVDGTSATIKNVYYDKKGKEVMDGEFTIVCEGNTVKMDFNNFIPEETLNQYGDADITVEGDFIAFPNDLTAGQPLPDGSGTITIKMSNAAAMNITMDMMITDRKVEKVETLETPAGSYETYKITQKTTMTMNMMGIKKTTESTSASWLARGVGMVKNESYDKKGSLIGYTLMTSFNK